MADRVAELKDALRQSMERSAAVVMGQRGVVPIPATGPGGEALGGNGFQSTFSTFATGYNGSVTVMPFQLDYSLLDGPDVLLA